MGVYHAPAGITVVGSKVFPWGVILVTVGSGKKLLPSLVQTELGLQTRTARSREGADKNHSRDRDIVLELCGGKDAGKRHKAAVNSCCLFRGRMGSDSETLPVVRCPGCEEPMQPKGAAPGTRELDDISYVCPKCGVETKRTMKRAG